MRKSQRKTQVDVKVERHDQPYRAQKRPASRLVIKAIKEAEKGNGATIIGDDIAIVVILAKNGITK